MKHSSILLFGLLSMGFFTIGCGDLGFDFDFTHTSPEYQIGEEGLLKADDPSSQTQGVEVSQLDFTGGWTEFTFDAGLEEVPKQLTGLEVRGVRFFGMDPESRENTSLEFVDRVEIYVLGDDGMPSFLVAAYQVGDQLDTSGGLRLEVVQHVNLIEYVEKGVTFYTFLQGSVPDARTNFHAEVDFRVYTRGY